MSEGNSDITRPLKARVAELEKGLREFAEKSRKLLGETDSVSQEQESKR